MVPPPGDNHQRIETAVAVSAVVVREYVLCEQVYLRATGNERIYFVAFEQRFQQHFQPGEVRILLDRIDQFTMYFVLIVVVGQDELRLVFLPLRMLLKKFQPARAVGTKQ